MKTLRAVAIGLAVVAVVFFAIGYFLPDKVHVERSLLIDAKAEQIFPYVNDLRLFNKWNPWAQLDPDTEFRHSGPENGVGARMEWSSANQNVGRGSQEIISSLANQRVETLLDFGEAGTATSFIQLEAKGNATNVTWGFDSDFKGSIIPRYFGLMYDSWIGKDYEKGLANLKSLLENNSPSSS